MNLTATNRWVRVARKAGAAGDTWLAERVYAGIPAGRVGVRQRIELGPGSGRANIVHWLRTHRFPEDPPLIERIREEVARATRVLRDEELLAIVARAQLVDAGDRGGAEE